MTVRLLARPIGSSTLGSVRSARRRCEGGGNADSDTICAIVDEDCNIKLRVDRLLGGRDSPLETWSTDRLFP